MEPAGGCGHDEGMGQNSDAGGSDARLWASAVSGDADAFGSLFDRHSAAVYNHCFRRSGSWSVADDLTSVVFLETWRRRRDIKLADDSQSLLPWLLGVANNAARNEQRSRRRYRHALAKLPPVEPTADHATATIERVDDERQMQRVLKAFDQLEAVDQDVLSLCAWAGLSYVETANALEIPVGTVRSRLSRARTRLRELSQGRGDDSPTGGSSQPAQVARSQGKPNRPARDTSVQLSRGDARP